MPEQLKRPREESAPPAPASKSAATEPRPRNNLRRLQAHVASQLTACAEGAGATTPALQDFETLLPLLDGPVDSLTELSGAFSERRE